MENHILPDVSVRVRALSVKQIQKIDRRIAESISRRDCARLRLTVLMPSPVISLASGIVGTIDCRDERTAKYVLTELRKVLASLDGVILEP
jgi:hypothetical protein